MTTPQSERGGSSHWFPVYLQGKTRHPNPTLRTMETDDLEETIMSDLIELMQLIHQWDAEECHILDRCQLLVQPQQKTDEYLKEYLEFFQKFAEHGLDKEMEEVSCSRTSPAMPEDQTRLFLLPLPLRQPKISPPRRLTGLSAHCRL
ncbi:hypothetical protein Q5P01_010812 [Channa striata]|uniref:Uncharacterized protein n=1 Tax=Channa striata TaxID=64152 RepID=A0AA88SSV1_CHASR|nr:hypothetical protein Q5P01_010812 [Channa striata]